MKDYYDILGVQKNATLEEIKKAYRSLSMEFHPDRHSGNVEFEEKFTAIKEAYELLIDEQNRSIYDRQIGLKNYENTPYPETEFAPIIVSFTSDKEAFKYGEDITFTWKTINAGRVIIRPFGEVPASGSKSYKIKDFRKPSLVLELIAENTHNQKTATKKLLIKSDTYKELEEHFRQKFKQEKSSKTPPPHEARRRKEKKGILRFKRKKK